MKAKLYLRISFLLLLILSISIIVFSYSRQHSAANQANPDCCGKCEQKKAQTEFILWEDLSRNLFSFNR